MKKLTLLIALLLCCATGAFGQGTQHDRINATTFENRAVPTINGPTPNVALGNIFQTSNPSTTTITNFLGALNPQRITLICGDTNTTIANNATIITSSGASVSCGAVNLSFEFVYNPITGAWTQVGSSGGGGGGGGCSVAGTNGDLQKNNGGSCAAAGINDNGSTVVVNSGRTLTVPLAGNAAVKPTSDLGMQYVSVDGNDSNDGQSWGTAKLTIVGALCALPNGNCASSPKQVGNGTVYFMDGVASNANANAGIWVAGTGDSQYASLPAGWMQSPSNGNFNLICASLFTPAAHSNKPTCKVTGPGFSSGSGNLPLIWLSATTSPIYINGLSNANGAPKWGNIGMDSAGSVNSGGSQVVSVTIENATSSLTSGQFAGGRGPALTVGNVFWVHIHDSSFGANMGESATISTASRTSNVVTITTSGVCPFLTGDHISITQATGDNGTFNGTFTAATGCSGGSTFTFAQNGPNASASGGWAASDRAFAMVLYGSQIELARMHEENGGGIKYYGQTAGNLQLNDIYMEGGGAGTQPIWWASTLLGGNGTIDVGGAFMSDTGANPLYINEGLKTFVHTANSQSTQAQGPGILINASDDANRTSGLLASGQSGWIGNQYFEAQSDIARRTGGPTSVNFPNLAGQVPSQWTSSISGISGDGYTTATGKRDPFGGTGATEIDWTGANGSAVTLYSINASVNVNDTYYFGAWVRAANFGLSYSPLVQFSLTGLGFGSGDSCYGGQGQINAKPVYTGDGNWFWVTGTCTIWANPSTAGLGFGIGSLDSNHPVQVFRPWFIKIPAGTLTGTETANEINSVALGYSTAAVPGDLAFAASQRLCLPSGSSTNDSCAYLAHANTANRTYTLPDAPLTFAGINLAQTWTQNQTFANGTELHFISTDLSHYAGFKGGASTTNLVWLFPTADSSGTQCLSSNGSLQLSWSACSGGTSTPGGSSTQVQYNSAGSFSASNAFTFDGTSLLGLGHTGVTGTLSMIGSTSGNANIVAQAVAGTPTLTLPNASGTFAVSASSPLALSATTGALTCPTCVTAATTSFGATTNVSPLFTTSVSNPTTTPFLTFSLSNIGAHSFLGNNTGGSLPIAAVSITAQDLPVTVVEENQGNTYTTGIQDFSTTTMVKARNSNPLTTSAIGDFGYDIASGNWHFWNGADLLVAPLAAGFVSGHCGQPTSVAGKWTVVDSGSACGSGGGGGTPGGASLSTQYNNSGSFGGILPPATPGFYTYGYNMPTSTIVAPTLQLQGVPVNAQSGSYSLLFSDRASYIKMSPSGPAATLTLPQVTGNTASGFPFVTQNINAIGTGNVTLTANAVDKIDGGAVGGSTIVLPKFAAFMYQDGTSAPGNWWSLNVPTSSSFGPTCNLILNWSTATGFSCNVATGGLFANFAPHQFLGNNTAGSTAPGPVMLSASDYSPNVFANTGGIGTSGGTSTAYTVTPAVPCTSLTPGLRISFYPVANNGTAPTLNACGLGVKNITKLGTSALALNDMVTTAVADVIYDGTQFELQNPITTSASSVALSAITPATASNTLPNADNPQIWNWAATTAGRSAFTIGETTAGTSTGTPFLLNVQTLNTSTLNPLVVTAQGTANGLEITKNAVIEAIGTGAFAIGATAHAPIISEGTTSAVATTAAGATNQVFLGNTGADPTWGQVPNAALVNASTTVAGNVCALGGTCTIPLDHLANPTSTQIFTMGANKVEFDTTTAVSQLLNFTNTLSASSGTPSNASTIGWNSQYWGTGPGSLTDTWTAGPVIGTSAGTNQPSTFTFTHTGSTGNATVQVPALLCGTLNTTSCIMYGYGSTSGFATLTWPAVAGTSTSAIVSSNNISAPAFTSTVSTGTAPLVVSSTTNVANLNASTVGGINLGTPVAGGIGYGTSTTQVGTTSAGTAKQVVLSGGTGTPTMIDFPDSKSVPFAICVNGTAATGVTTTTAVGGTCRAGTNNKDAFLGPFTTSDTAIFKVHLPKDWDTGTAPNLSVDVATTDAVAHTIILQAATACAKLDGSTTDDVAFNAAQAMSTINTNTTANQTWTTTLTGLTTTGCSAPGIMWVKITRTTDTATNVELYQADVTIPRLLTMQAN